MLKRIVLVLGVILIVLIAGTFGYIYSITVERPVAPGPLHSELYNTGYQQAAKEADQWLLHLYKSNQIPSLSAAVGVKGELVWAGAVGYKNLQESQPVAIDTQYRIGSISKPFTSVAALRLQEKGFLDINKTFNSYWPEFSKGSAEYSVKQLMSHQAGIRHYRSMVENFKNTDYPTTHMAAEIVEHDPLLCSPGDCFNYSTYGYTLLALAMEQAAKSSFEEILFHELIIPLNLESTRLDSPRAHAENNVAETYLFQAERLLQAPEVNLSYKYAGGGLLSTPSDVVKFGNALLTNNILSSASKKLLWEPGVLSDGSMNPDGYALGFRVGEDEFGRFIHHGGMSVGGTSFFIIYPKSDIVVAFASNVAPLDSGINRYIEAKKLFQIFMGSSKH